MISGVGNTNLRGCMGWGSGFSEPLGTSTGQLFIALWETCGGGGFNSCLFVHFVYLFVHPAC